MQFHQRIPFFLAMNGRILGLSFLKPPDSALKRSICMCSQSHWFIVMLCTPKLSVSEQIKGYKIQHKKK